jgi:hypothetical protein
MFFLACGTYHTFLKVKLGDIAKHKTQIPLINKLLNPYGTIIDIQIENLTLWVIKRIKI